MTDRPLVEAIEAEYRRYKVLAERAIEQVADADLTQTRGPSDNSIAVLMWHIGGNLKSRFTDFLTTDGEKPWRERDQEFVARTNPRPELLAQWNEGWQALFDALGGLDDTQLRATVTIRQQPLRVHETLNRSLAHIAYHVGQMVMIAKEHRGADWTYLSIPPGKSADYNANPTSETADAFLRATGSPESGA